MSAPGAELREIIQQRKPQMQAALRALWEFEEDAALELDLLVSLIGDTDPEVRFLATHALARIGELAAPAGPTLLHLAPYGSEREKSSALFGLQRIRYDEAIFEQVCAESDGYCHSRLN